MRYAYSVLSFAVFFAAFVGNSYAQLGSYSDKRAMIEVRLEEVGRAVLHDYVFDAFEIKGKAPYGHYVKLFFVLQHDGTENSAEVFTINSPEGVARIDRENLEERLGLLYEDAGRPSVYHLCVKTCLYNFNRSTSPVTCSELVPFNVLLENNVLDLDTQTAPVEQVNTRLEILENGPKTTQ